MEEREKKLDKEDENDEDDKEEATNTHTDFLGLEVSNEVKN